MIRTSIGRNAALAGVISVALTGAPAVAAIGPAKSPSQPAQQQISCLNSGHSVYHLATIDNASDKSFQCLGVSLERGMVVGIRVETHHVAPPGRPADVSIEEFPLAVVESNRGAVLDGVPGHDAIILRGSFPTSPDKMELVTSYLYNGFTNEYRSCPITLDREPNGGWYYSIVPIKSSLISPSARGKCR